MEVIPLKEYVESRPIEKDKIITNQRSCIICHKFYHYKNVAYIMATKTDGYGSASFNLCPNCLSHWKKDFIRDRHPVSFDEWHFSTWNLDKPIPHSQNDRVLLYLMSEEFFIHIDYNPSRRARNMIQEEIR